MRYLFTSGVIIFAIFIFVNPFEKVFLGLMTLSVSLVMIIQSIELKLSEAEPRKDSQVLISIIACVLCISVSTYIFSTLR